MPSIKQSFISGYLEGEQARIISASHMDAILHATTITEVLAAINGTDIGDYLENSSINSFAGAEEYLWSYYNKCLGTLQWLRFAPNDVRNLLSVYVEKFDVLNIKSTLWRITSKQEVQLIPLGSLQNGNVLGRLSVAEDMDSVISVLEESGMKKYAQVLEDNENNILSGPARFVVESKLDSLYYSRLLDTVRKLGESKTFIKSISLVIDLTNLQKVFRSVVSGIGTESEGSIISGGTLNIETIRELMSLKLVDIPARLSNSSYGDIAREIATGYEHNKSITVIDEIIEKHRFRMLKDNLSLKIMSPLVVLWYLVLKEIEVRNMRLVLKGILDKTPMADIRNFMVIAS